MASFTRIVNGTGTARDRREMVRRLPRLSRRQLKAMAEILTGRPLFGLKESIAARLAAIIAGE